MMATLPARKAGSSCPLLQGLQNRRMHALRDVTDHELERATRVDDPRRVARLGSVRVASYLFAVFATVASPSMKSAALLNSMISQATGASLSMIMVWPLGR